ncbi:MAG: arsenite efflux transporter metallochaperone ArsD [Dehalococcoidia bacterium]|nr:arsenite efflux transporter metallochaperone ArsD [Dehalococcoidia bacterium]
MREIILYEPTLCCSSGVCGPNPDQALIALQDTIASVKERGVVVERFQITTHPRKFTENADVMKLMQQRQLEALPITVVDSKIIKAGSYPSLAELLPYL